MELYSGKIFKGIFGIRTCAGLIVDASGFEPQASGLRSYFFN